MAFRLKWNSWKKGATYLRKPITAYKQMIVYLIVKYMHDPIFLKKVEQDYDFNLSSCDCN